jgi:hypothetical protein
VTDIRENLKPLLLVFLNKLRHSYNLFALPGRNQYAYGLYIRHGISVDSVCMVSRIMFLTPPAAR